MGANKSPHKSSSPHVQCPTMLAEVVYVFSFLSFAKAAGILKNKNIEISNLTNARRLKSYFLNCVD